MMMALMLCIAFTGITIMLLKGVPKSEEEQKEDDEAQMRYLKDWKNKKNK